MNANREVYDLIVPVKGWLYSELMTSLRPLASTMGMIVRSPLVRLDTRAAELQSALSPFLTSLSQVNAWPGTQIVGSRLATLFVYAVTEESFALMRSVASNLDAWVSPELPEDLHLRRADGSVLLGSVTQDSDAWLEFSPEEYEEWSAVVPIDLVAALRPATQRP